jgi:RNA polymerase sigma factor (TIGR02999 family)
MNEKTSQLWHQVYDELREIARAKLRQEKPGQTLQATAIVNEAYMRLQVQGKDIDWRSRSAFFKAAAETIRRIMIDRARRKLAIKRGEGNATVQVEPNQLAQLAVDLDKFDEELVIALNEALMVLSNINPQAAQLVELRFFGGLDQSQVADTLEIPKRTCDRLWAWARAWLYREIKQEMK